MAVAFVAAGTVLERSGPDGVDGTAVSGTIPLPSGWAAGQFAVAFHAGWTIFPLTMSAGWTPIGSIQRPSSPYYQQMAWWRRLQSGDAAPTISTTMDSRDVMQDRILTFTGVRTVGNPVEDVETQEGSGTSIPLMTVTTTGVDRYPLIVHGNARAVAHTAPSGWTKIAESLTGSGDDAALSVLGRVAATAGAYADTARTLGATGPWTKLGFALIGPDDVAADPVVKAHVNDAGTWKTSVGWVKDAGIWKPMTAIGQNVSGTWDVEDLATGEPAFSTVVLLAGFNGSNGATSYTEESSYAKTASFTSTTALSTTSPKFGTACLARNTGASTTRVGFPASTDWQIMPTSTSKFTIEMWVKFASVSTPGSNEYLIGQWTATGNQRAWAIIRSTANELRFQYSLDGIATSDALVMQGNVSGLTAGTWYSVCVECDGSFIRTYLNGVMTAKSAPLGAIFHAASDTMDFHESASATAIVYIDEARITKGAARYASDAGYTPAVAAFPRS